MLTLYNIKEKTLCLEVKNVYIYTHVYVYMYTFLNSGKEFLALF